MRRRAEVLAAAAQLAEAIDSHGCATRVLPRGLPAAKRAARLDVITASVAELRRSRPAVRARTVSGQRTGNPDAEMTFVSWEGRPPPFLDEDGGER